MNRTLLAGLGLGALALCLACPSNAPPPKAGGKELAADLSKLPPDFKLDLPTAPIAARKSNVPVQHADRSHSVSGVFGQRAALLGKEVTVTGFLVELKVPQKAKAGEKFTPAHLFLADAPTPTDTTPRLLVADFEPEQVEELEVGMRYRFTGTYSRSSGSRFSRTEGLLSFKSVTPAAGP